MPAASTGKRESSLLLVGSPRVSHHCNKVQENSSVQASASAGRDGLFCVGTERSIADHSTKGLSAIGDNAAPCRGVRLSTPACGTRMAGRERSAQQRGAGRQSRSCSHQLQCTMHKRYLGSDRAPSSRCATWTGHGTRSQLIAAVTVVRGGGSQETSVRKN